MGRQQFEIPQGHDLSEALQAAGFKNVMGWAETARGQHFVINRGVPFTWDSNNGVTAVYDEVGDPWVRRGSTRTEDMPHDLQRGAHVPMSNDGGNAIQSLFPKEEL